jgi:hypothetical protein
MLSRSARWRRLLALLETVTENTERCTPLALCVQVRRGDGSGGERGLWCTQSEPEGTVLLTVPLHWALVVRGDDNAEQQPPADSRVLAVQVSKWSGGRVVTV